LSTDSARAVIAHMEAFVNGEMREFMQALATELQEATPKDTTHASYNWIWSLVRRSFAAGSREAVDIGAFLTGLHMISRYSIHWGKAYMDNLVHYIGKLDQGWSPQAPPGFVFLIIRKVLSKGATP
jgi:hypothetical protein